MGTLLSMKYGTIRKAEVTKLSSYHNQVVENSTLTEQTMRNIFFY